MRKGLRVRILGGNRVGKIVLKSRSNIMVLWEQSLSYTWHTPCELERL